MVSTTMTVLLPSVFLPSVLLLSALGGPRVLRQVAPTLAVISRFAIGALTAIALIWIAALVAVGPIIAWISSGPAWLPEQVASVCSRCLSAATPFGESSFSLGIPAVIPLALPMVGAAAILIGLFREFGALRRSRATLAMQVRDQCEAVTLLGYRVRVSPDMQPYAFALPFKHGGIVVSRGAIISLTSLELTAVLAHEQAHLRQRHHLCLAILKGATRYFRWIPLIAAIRGAVPHYLEIAADEAAKRVTGTSALASALLKLGEQPQQVGTAQIPLAAVFHAAGTDRIRHLIGQPPSPRGTALTAAAGAYAFMMLAVIAAVQWPYFIAILTGC